MKIQSYAANAPQKPNNNPPSQPPKEETTVTYDAVERCYHYESPGYHRSVCKVNPFAEGAKAAALVGVPAAIGAGQSALLGTLGGTAVNLIVGPSAGALIGGTAAGVMAWKGTNENPVYTGLAALLGAGVGAVAFPVLQLPGTLGGGIGALAAAGVAGVGVGIWMAHENGKADAEARAHGYKPE